MGTLVTQRGGEGSLCGGTGVSKGTEVGPRGLGVLELRGAQDHGEGGVRKAA